MKKIYAKFSLLTLLCMLLLNVAYAQNITVKGVVKDDQGITIPSASVMIKGTNGGVQTDMDGNFTISAPASGTLVFTYIGFTTQEVAINNRTTINVTLAMAKNDLEQVVVVGYGTQKKKDVTGSITSVKSADIEKFTVTNPLAALQGKVPGLTIVNSGSPGASPTVRIRGVSSTNSASPLYIVDGQMVDNIDFLNPSDIESIDLLRDASSIAIYGLRGANGVIAITTKVSARGKTTVNFQSTYGIQRVTDRIDVTDAEGFKKLYSTQLANLNGAAQDYTNYTANTDWQDLILRNAAINTNSLSISNSGEKSTTLINIGYNNQDGVVKYNNFKKFIARINEEIRITDKIKVGGNFTGFHFRANPSQAGLNNAIWAAPIVDVQSPNGLYNTMPLFQRAQVGNPIYALERNRNTSINRGYRVNASIFAEIKFLKDFTLRSTVYTDLGFNNSRDYSPLPFTVVNLGEGAAATETFYDRNVRTTVSQEANEYRKYQQDHTITYDKEFTGGHRVTAVGGFSTYFASSTTLSGSRRDTTLNVPNDPDLWYLGIINANNPTFNSGGGGEESNAGFFLRGSYAFQNKYLLNATVRRDGSSKFPQNLRTRTFGSVGLGWVASEESFFKDNVKGIDFLKIRGSWGRIGNSNGVPNNYFQIGLSSSATAIFGDNIYTAVTNAYRVDPNLGYEIVQGVDLGLEVRALNNRLSAEIGLYNKTTSDIITSFPLLGTLGNETFFTNLGKITNKGIEVMLGWNDKIGKEFTYNVNANFGYNKNFVNSLGNATNFQIQGNGGVNITESGRSIGYFYGYQQTGIYQNTADIAQNGSFADSQPGDIKYADLNGDGLITPADRTYLGTPFPPYSYGLSLSMAYKGFDATIEGQGVAGNKIYTQRRTANFAVLNYESNRLNAWTGAGSTNVEPILNNARSNNFLFSSYYLEDGDYFRLRNVQVGYTFSANALTKVGVSKLRLFLSGQN
ncbi:MAG: TonB-dependent receptor, partial [Flavobacterium sp.]